MNVDQTAAEANEQIASASRSRRWQDVVAVWEHRAPGSGLSEEAYLGVSSAYKELGKLDETDRVLGEGALAFPKSLQLLSERAWLDLRRGRHLEALQHWEGFIQLFPTEAVGIIGYAAALRDLRRYALADILLEGGRVRFPGSVRMATDFARLAQTAGLHDEAMRRWRDLIVTFPTSHVGYRGVAELLRNNGQLDEAVDAIEKGLDVLPKSLELRSFHAWLATYKQQWDEAELRWQYVKDNYPDTPAMAKEIALGIGEIKMGRGLHAIDGGASKRPSADEPSTTDGSTLTLFERWESLGDDCEFGIVQRHYGAEPISLLRWTATRIVPLTLGFEQDFEGVGAIENTQISVRSGEYCCEDKRFGLGMHTFIRVSVEDEQKVLVTMANRMVFLRRKLLEDLEDGEKSFVYKARTTPDDETVLALHAAMQRRGKNRLLVVVKAGEEEAAGTIRLLQPDVAVGYMKDFGNRPGYWDIDHKGWLDLCAGAEKTFGISI